MTKLDDRVTEWEAGLPGPDELTPLSQVLITPELACAFSISPEPCRSQLDVSRASKNTMSALRRQNSAPVGSMKGFPAFSVEEHEGHELDGGQTRVNGGGGGQAGVSQVAHVPFGGESSDGGGFKKGRNRETEEPESSASGFENSSDEHSARTLKRPRLVWTPQLHRRFVDVVSHLGIKNAVPKTIMQLMNVEGLTRENVASHLQKYRLYLKRMQGLSNEGPSLSDHLFASTPVPYNHAASAFPGNHGDEHMQMPMPYGSPLVRMPVVGMAHGHAHGHGHMTGHGHGHMTAAGMNPSTSYAVFDPHAYGPAYARSIPQRIPSGDHHDSVADRMEMTSSYHNAAGPQE